MTDLTRCPWCLRGGDGMRLYHDAEWGVPVRDDRVLFEMIVLESAQAGLSWSTVLAKRAAYEAAFSGFDPVRVAGYTKEDEERVLSGFGIVRNRMKVASAVTNARAFLELQAKHGSFARWYWGFADGRPVSNAWKTKEEIPARTPLSERLSKEMRRAGFTFFGPVTAYAFMQGTGMVNDHLTGCFRYEEIAELQKRFSI